MARRWRLERRRQGKSASHGSDRRRLSGGELAVARPEDGPLHVGGAGPEALANRLEGAIQPTELVDEPASKPASKPADEPAGEPANERAH